MSFNRACCCGSICPLCSGDVSSTMELTLSSVSTCLSCADPCDGGSIIGVSVTPPTWPMTLTWDASVSTSTRCTWSATGGSVTYRVRGGAACAGPFTEYTQAFDCSFNIIEIAPASIWGYSVVVAADHVVYFSAADLVLSEQSCCATISYPNDLTCPSCSGSKGAVGYGGSYSVDCP